MKKYFLIALMGLMTVGTLVSCTQDEEDLEILSPDKDKQECPGCDND